MNIITKKYGPKEIVDKKLIDDTELYLARINVDGIIKLGIVDEENNEIIPFGTFFSINKVRIIDNNNFVLDYSDSLMGSFYIHKNDNQYVVYNSNAAIILINENKVFGASFDTIWEVGNDVYFPTKTFEYDYKNGLLEEKRFDVYAYTNGTLQKYLILKYLDYPSNYNQLNAFKQNLASEIFEEQINSYDSTNKFK